MSFYTLLGLRFFCGSLWFLLSLSCVSNVQAAVPPVANTLRLYFADNIVLGAKGLKLAKTVLLVQTTGKAEQLLKTDSTARGMRSALQSFALDSGSAVQIISASAHPVQQIRFLGDDESNQGIIKLGSDNFKPDETQKSPTYEAELFVPIREWVATKAVADTMLRISLFVMTDATAEAQSLPMVIGEEIVPSKGLELFTRSVASLRKSGLGTLTVATSEKVTTDPLATEKETIAALRAKFPKFQDHQVYRDGNTVYLFLNRLLQVAPGTAWPDCNEKGTGYQLVVIDKPASGVAVDKYRLATEVNVIRDPSLRFDGANGVAGAQRKQEEPKVTVLADQSIAARTGTLLITATLRKEGDDGTPTRQSFRVPDCDLTYHVGIMLGVNASFLSTPTNIATSLLPNTTTNYTLVADDPTTHQALTVMALFYPTPRRYGYEYKELSFFQKFNVSVGSQVGPALLSDVLVGLNYEVARGLNIGAGGHYGRHRVIIGQPNFKFGEDVYAGGSTFTEAINTRMQWDLAWYVGLGIDLRVIGVLSGRDREVRDLRGTGSGPVSPASSATTTAP